MFKNTVGDSYCSKSECKLCTLGQSEGMIAIPGRSGMDIAIVQYIRDL